MSEIADEGFDFEAALAAKLAPEAEETPAEEVVEETIVEEAPRARDESGRFVAAETEPVVETTEERTYAGRFKSPEELERGYEELNSLLGRQGQETGERISRLEAQLAQQEEQYAPVDQGTLDTIDELTDRNPAQAAMWALQNQPALYDRVMDSWYEMPGEARRASTFERRIELHDMQAQIQEENNARLQPLAAQAQTNEFNQAWAEVGKTHTDLNEFANDIIKAAGEAPEVVSILQSGKMEDKERVIKNLYHMAKGMKTTTVASAVQDAVTQTAAQSTQAKRDATVVSASSTATHEEKSPVDRFKEAFRATPLGLVDHTE